MTFDHDEWHKRFREVCDARQQAEKAVYEALTAERNGKIRNERTFRPLVDKMQRARRAYDALHRERDDHYAMHKIDAFGHSPPYMPTIVEEDSMAPTTLIFPTQPTGEDE